MIEITSMEPRPDKFEIGHRYEDGLGFRWTCVKPKWGRLPEFVNNPGMVRIVMAPDGRYRFDGQDDPRDMVRELFDYVPLPGERAYWDRVLGPGGGDFILGKLDS